MMVDTDNALWISQEMAEALRSRLGDAYAAYMSNLKQIQRITESLAEKLDIDGVDKVCGSSLSQCARISRTDL